MAFSSHKPINDVLIPAIQLLTKQKDASWIFNFWYRKERGDLLAGEDGLAKAYERKIDEIKPWLDDDDTIIVNFAENYISDLERQVEAEKKRSAENIALRKHQYGTDEQ